MPNQFIRLFLTFLTIFFLISCESNLTVENGSGSGLYSIGNSIPIKANPPKSDERFFMWKGSTYVQDPYSQDTTVKLMRKDVVVTAIYSSINEKYQVEVKNGKGGGEFFPGEKTTIIADAPPSDNYKFSNWTGDTSYLQNPKLESQSLRVLQKDLYFEANYKEKFHVDVKSGTGSGNYFEGENVTITANPPAAEEAFKEWIGDTSVLSDKTIKSQTFKMVAGDLDFEATYKDAPSKHRVLISSDIGGYDPDDEQSLIHLLMYANDLEIEGIVASPPGHGNGVTYIRKILDAYKTDYPKLKNKGYPEPDDLSQVVRQGAVNPSPENGYSNSTDGSRLIVERAHIADDRPLYILVWGSITDIAQAIHDDPSIKSKIRVYYIGSWNTDMDKKARNYIYNNHSDLWMIESDSTHRGMYMGGNQSGDLGNHSFVEQHINGRGALGAYFFAVYRPECQCNDIKMGDTPTVLYMLNGDPTNPEKESWGGRFVKTGHGPNYWTDDHNSAYSEYDNSTQLYGAKTVNKHREAFLRDWQKRMDYLK